MKKLRYLIAAALIAGSMAVYAGAVRTVTPQEALQSSIAQVQQQWQNENDKSMYFIDGDGYGGYASPLVPSKNLYTISLDIDGYIKYGFLDGVVNIETGEMVIPLEYDTIDVLADNKILIVKGAIVHPRDVVGITGSTGRSTGEHLHITCKLNGRNISPSLILDYIQSIRQECISALAGL